MLVAALTALAALALLSAAETADAKKKRKQQSAAGLYVGVTSHIGAGQYPKVTFRLTRGGTVVNFVISDVPLLCEIEDRMPGSLGFRTQVDTIAPPPMSLGAGLPRRGLPIGLSFLYEDPLPPPPPTFGPPPPPGSPPYRGIHVDGRTVIHTAKPFDILPNADVRGHANMATFNNTRGAVGTEECHASELESTSWGTGFDWAASKKAVKKRKKRRK
jgi:hypothetical protein